jgi:hypothetical protein
VRIPDGPNGNPRSNFYREEFVKCQRCLEERREYYSEGAIRDAERALTRVMSQLDHLCTTCTTCTTADADQVVSGLLRQFDIVTGLSAWSDVTAIARAASRRDR